MLRAAIRAGCHYVDVCDDWEPTLEMLALDTEARAAGVTAVIGLGASPGITNLLAVQAIPVQLKPTVDTPLINIRTSFRGAAAIGPDAR